MALEDMTLNEVTCCECGKPISTIPTWMAGAKVKFQCEECRQKHPRIPGMAEVDTRRSLSASEDVAEHEEVVHDMEEEAEEEPVEESDDYAE